MPRNKRICLLLCTAIGAWSAGEAATAYAADPPPLPTVPGVDAQGAVEGTVGTVTGTAGAVPGVAAPPPAAAPSDPGLGPGHGDGAKQVGTTVAGTAKGAADTAGTAKGDVEAAVGAVTRPLQHEPGATPAPAEAASPKAPESESAPVEEAAPPPTESTSTASAAAPSPSGPSAGGDHRSAAATPRAGADIAEDRKATTAADPAGTTRGTPIAVTAAIAAATEGVAPSSSLGSAGGAESTEMPTSAGPTGEAHRSLRFSDFVPGNTALGTLAFLLVLGAGALALTLVMRRELGMNFLPWRRYRG